MAISCAFNENAISALSRYASTHGILTERFVPHWDVPTDTAELLSRLFKGSESLARFAERKKSRLTSSRISEDKPVSWLAEIIRIAGARTRTPATPFLGNYAWKAHFDYCVSRRLESSRVDVVIGMPGSSKHTFTRHNRPLNIFHAIDTHPRARNEALFGAYGTRARAELYPPILIKRIERELHLADVVLTPSRVVVDGMIRHGVDANKIELVPFGVDLGLFDVDEIPPRLNLDTTPRLLFAGQICLRKGVPLLIEAVRGLDVQLTLAGQIFDRSIIRDLPTNVSLAGVLSRAELAQAYNQHDAMVLPTVDDACSLVVAEAAASGIQVVTTSANGAVELLPEGHVIVQPGSAQRLREALSSVRVLDAGERKKASAALRDHAIGHIRSWDSYAAEVFNKIETRLAQRA